MRIWILNCPVMLACGCTLGPETRSSQAGTPAWAAQQDLSQSNNATKAQSSCDLFMHVPEVHSLVLENMPYTNTTIVPGDWRCILVKWCCMLEALGLIRSTSKLGPVVHAILRVWRLKDQQCKVHFGQLRSRHA